MLKYKYVEKQNKLKNDKIVSKTTNVNIISQQIF